MTRLDSVLKNISRKASTAWTGRSEQTHHPKEIKHKCTLKHVVRQITPVSKNHDGYYVLLFPITHRLLHSKHEKNLLSNQCYNHCPESTPASREGNISQSPWRWRRLKKMLHCSKESGSFSRAQCRSRCL